MMRDRPGVGGRVFSLARLVHFLVAGGAVSGERLIVSGAVIWVTNVLLFAVWYWEMDRGGPVARFRADHPSVRLPVPADGPRRGHEGVAARLRRLPLPSLTNSVAFSPTDTMPLTQTAKLVMACSRSPRW